MENFFDIGGGLCDINALKYVLDQLNDLEECFDDVKDYELQGMSLFIAMHTAKTEYICRLINLSSIKPIAPDKSKGIARDNGAIKGIKSIRGIVRRLHVQTREKALELVRHHNDKQG